MTGDKAENHLPHEPDAATSTLDLYWNWVAIGVGVGVILLGTLVPVVRHQTPRPDVALLVGGLTFLVMGIFVGYRSPGETIREAALAGVFLVVLSFLAIGIGFELPITAGLAAGGLLLGVALSALGGWVGEILQGTMAHGTGGGGLAWPWILVGAVVGLLLNVYTVFVLQLVLDLAPAGVLTGFLASFVVMAFLVGYASPGFTILEPALAAVIVIAADMLLVVAGFAPAYAPGQVALAAAGAFLLALGGGYAGEMAAAGQQVPGQGEMDAPTAGDTTDNEALDA